jgi:hypothetical protein
VIFF